MVLLEVQVQEYLVDLGLLYDILAKNKKECLQNCSVELVLIEYMVLLGQDLNQHLDQNIDFEMVPKEVVPKMKQYKKEEMEYVAVKPA